MAKVKAPNSEYTGTGPAGVVFTDGQADTDDEAALNYFRAAGYTVDGDAAELPAAEEPPDPRDDQTNLVGTALRDAAVDPVADDFLAPINAGEGNPHGPTVVSPELHDSGAAAGLRPGEVFVDDLGKQEQREKEFADLRLRQQQPMGDAVDAEVPDRDARGPLGLSDPGSAEVGTREATGDTADADAAPAKPASRSGRRKS